MNQTADHIDVEPALKHLCIVQLTGLSHLIQTIQAVQGLKEDNTLFLTIIARKSHGHQIKFLLDKFFHRVVLIQNSDIVGENINNLCLNIQKKVIDALVNFSYCSTSKSLCSLLKARHKLGPFICEKSNEVIVDRWSQYFRANVFTGNNNVFSLVDLYKLILGNKNYRFKDLNLNERTNIVVIHPFTSQERASWSSRKWIEMLYALIKKENICIYLVGGTTDIKEAETIYNAALIRPFLKNIVNCVGIKTVLEVYLLLEKAKLFIGHNSMVGHLAALSETPTLTISLGNSRPIETSPYNQNGLVLSPRIQCFPCRPEDPCSNFICHNEINYQTVLSLATQMLSQGGAIDYDDIFKNLSEFNFTNTNLYRSSFSNTGKYQLLKISQQKEEVNEVFNRLYRIAWQCVLGDEDEHHELQGITVEVLDRFVTLKQGLQHIFELCDFAQRYIGYILEEVQKETPHISVIKKYLGKIDDIDKLLTVVSKTSPELIPLKNYSIVVKSNLLGSNIVDLSQSTFLIYEQLKNLSSVLYELTEKTISHNAPKKGRTHDKDFC